MSDARRFTNRHGASLGSLEHWQSLPVYAYRLQTQCRHAALGRSIPQVSLLLHTVRLPMSNGK